MQKLEMASGIANDNTKQNHRMAELDGLRTLAILFALIGSILFGFITWHMIERPAIRYGRKKFG